MEKEIGESVCMSDKEDLLNHTSKQVQEKGRCQLV